MIIFLIMCVVFFALIIALRGTISTGNNSARKSSSVIGKYEYRAKKHLMTSREEYCFVTLNRIFNKKYYVIPQVHLSALFDHQINRQNWKGAFAHINGKSVDFVLLDKHTLAPVCAIELDDSSHDTAERRSRDNEVERIFEQAKLPLVRLRQFEKMSAREIVDYFKNTIAAQRLVK